MDRRGLFSPAYVHAHVCVRAHTHTHMHRCTHTHKYWSWCVSIFWHCGLKTLGFSSLVFESTRSPVKFGNSGGFFTCILLISRKPFFFCNNHYGFKKNCSSVIISMLLKFDCLFAPIGCSAVMLSVALVGRTF